MHSIIDKNGKCIGQYIYIRDDKYSTRIFTRYYNMCMNVDKENPMTEKIIRDSLEMEKYNLENIINVYDINTNQICLKPLISNTVMIYLVKENKLYLVTEKELNKFIEDNEYTSLLSIVYIIGLSDGYKFKNVRPVSSDSAEHAKEIYKYRYKINEEPIVIGVKESGHLYINLNDHILEAEIDESTIIKHKD